MRGLSLVAASGGHSSSQCTGLSLSWPLLLRSTGSRCAGSVVVAHGPSFSVACGIFPDQRSNPCPLHWQADSQPLRHQGSPPPPFLSHAIYCLKTRHFTLWNFPYSGLGDCILIFHVFFICSLWYLSEYHIHRDSVQVLLPST